MVDAAGPQPSLSSEEKDGGEFDAPLHDTEETPPAAMNTLVLGQTPLGIRLPVDHRGREARFDDTTQPPAPASMRVRTDDGAQMPSRGALLGGVYRVIGQLGEGAMGVILLARDEHLQRDVAIKLLRPEQLDNMAMQARLLIEAQAMARVHHPNVVEIYAFGEHNGAPYFQRNTCPA